MEIKNILGRSSKGQLMTILVLIMFLLMLSALFAFALIGINANSASQSLSASLSSTNYGALLRQSANTFAKESASRALIVLANYEYNPSLRKGNFISGFGAYASNLMVSGTLPGDTSGYPQNAMGSLTFNSYNAQLAGQIGLGQNVIISETTPVFFQTDPYHLRVSYAENVTLTASGSRYNYAIPVNATISLNNTPDLFYAQQGVLRTVKFASLGNLTSQMGGVYASSGNTVGFAYGTVDVIPGSTSTCPSAPFSSNPMNVIIATSNAMGLSSCIGSYAGLITTQLPTSGYSAIPYLVYTSAAYGSMNLYSGMKVLLYGPGMDTLSVEGLRNAVMNGQYFASPFTPSYIDRAGANFLNQSPNGIFTFSNYNTQAAYFNGANYIATGTNSLPLGNSPSSFFAWINTPSTATTPVFFDYGKTGTAGGMSSLVISGSNMGFWNGATFYADATAFPLNTMTFVGWTYNGGTSLAIYLGSTSQTFTITQQSVVLNAQYPSVIGAYGGQATLSQYFQGSIANAQLYSTALTPQQVQQLYQEGISGVPISGNSLVGWWPLNGNANDLSGNNNNGVPTSMAYTLPSNYVRDSALVTTTPTTPQPVPGVLSCTSNSRCSSSSLPNLYLSYMPLEVQSGLTQVGNFNGASSNILIGNSNSLNIATGGSVTMCAWAYSNTGSSAGWQGLMAKRTSTYSYGINFMTGSLQVYTSGSSGVESFNYNLPAMKWTFICGVISPSPTALYVNGGLFGTAGPGGGVSQSNLNAFAIGSSGNIGAEFFNGLISNAQIYNAALNANQVQQLYQEGISGVPISGNSLVGWWPLNGNANDYSGNGNNGTAYNVNYPYFSGTYSAPGLSTISSTANEWQALGLANT